MLNLLLVLHPVGYRSRSVLEGVGRFIREYGGSHVHMMHTLMGGLGDGQTPYADISRYDAAVVEIPDEDTRSLQTGGLPVVSVEQNIVDPEIPYRVTLDNASVGMEAAKHLRARQFSHFAAVGSGGMLCRRRADAFADHLRPLGREASVLHVPGQEGFFASWPLEEKITHWLADLPSPIGIFATKDDLAVLVVQAAQRLGRRVPEDVAVVGTHNDAMVCEVVSPTISSVQTPAEAVGYRAAQIAAKLAAGETPTGLDDEGRLCELLPASGVEERASSNIVMINDPDVSAALAYIREHLPDVAGVEAVAEHVAMSRRGLEVRFRRAMRMGVGQYLRRARLDHARHLLIHTELTVAQIAERCGFSSGNRLSDVFARQEGQTPTHFRGVQRGQVATRETYSRSGRM